MKSIKYLLLILSFFSFLTFAPNSEVSAQSCDCQNIVVNQGDCSPDVDINGDPIIKCTNSTVTRWFSGLIAPGDPFTCEFDKTWSKCTQVGSTCVLDNYSVINVCPAPGCGDGSCNNGETNGSCAIDCPPVDVCGDGACTGSESNGSCAIDCPADPPLGWGGCGSCGSCPPGPADGSECVQDPNGVCWHDPKKCGSIPPAAPGCNLAFQGAAYEVPLGESIVRNLHLSFWKNYGQPPISNDCINPEKGGIMKIASNNGAIASITPNKSCGIKPVGPAFWEKNINVTITGNAIGATRVYATGRIPGAGSPSPGYCNNNRKVTVIPPPPWFAIDGGCVSVGDEFNPLAKVTSKIPSSCTAAAGCNPVMCRSDSDSNTPGVLVAGGTVYVKDGAVSDPQNWSANTASYAYSDISYDYFENLASGTAPFEFDPAAWGGSFRNGAINDPGGAIDSGNFDQNGNIYIHVNGNITIGNLNINGTFEVSPGVFRPIRVVLFVDDGDVNITGRIRVNKPENNIFVLIVGEDDAGINGGNINVTYSAQTSTGGGGQPSMAGVYFLEGVFSTGTDGVQNDLEFSLYGSVAALGGFNLERDRGINNDINPAEVFENAPEFQLNFPRPLTEKNLYWREVAP